MTTDVEIVSYPQEIRKHNAMGLCCESTCDGVENQHMTIKLYGMELHIILCDEHAEKIHEAIMMEKKNKKI